jgi:tetratricopeptide (TPR) repeat protein
VDLFEHAVKVTEGNYPMHNNLCVIYNRMEKYDKAIEHGAKAVLAKPDFARLYYNLGIPLLRAGRIDEAVKCWERNIALGGMDSKVHTNLGSVYYSRGKIDLAIEHFLRAVEIDENFLANAKLGRIMTNKGDFILALDYYRRSIEANPNRSDIRYEYALLLENQGQLDEAIRQYQLALKFNPDFQKARKALDAAMQKRKN